MRAFEIYVSKENNVSKVSCDIPKMHVPPGTQENFAVYLKTGLETKYKLANLRFKNNQNGALTQQRLNESTIILHDENKSPGEPKFSVALTPKGSNPKVAKLDPVVVNE